MHTFDKGKNQYNSEKSSWQKVASMVAGTMGGITSLRESVLENTMQSSNFRK